MKISSIHSRQILDSRGNPTVEADVVLDDGTLGRASVPSGASTGTHEALELRDGDKSNYNGNGVLKAVENINTKINQALIGFDPIAQAKLDQTMLELDGTENKQNLGANAILAVSLASAKAAAAAMKIPLYQHINALSSKKPPLSLPLPMLNVINGGKHAGWVTDIQEFIVFPTGASNYSEALKMGVEVFHVLGKVLNEKGYSTSVGDEGGYAPNVKNGNSEPLELISEAIEKAGFSLGQDFVFGLDTAASEFFENGKYNLKTEGKVLSTDQMIEWLINLSQKFPIVSMEDCLDQEDWEGWKKLTQKIGDKVQLVGDDLLVTNTKFLKRGIEENAANAILIKVNQIGTLTETIQAIEMAHQANWRAVTSHRSGETEDTTIAHIAVGMNTGQIKTGSLSRTDRTSKYNELLRIEEQLGPNALYLGNSIFK